MSHGVVMPKTGSEMRKNNENQREAIRDLVLSSSTMAQDFRLRMGMWA